MDRLDHLGHQYYKQPTKWWRICDANPRFLSPQGLLGRVPIATTRFPVTFDEGDASPPWSAVLKKLSEALGVLDVKLQEKIRLTSGDIDHDGQTVTLYRQQLEWAIVVTFNRLNVSRRNLIALLVAEGLDVGQPEAIGRVGKQIVIPSNV